MRFNSVAVPNRFSRIARALGVNAGGRAEEDVIADGIEAVRSLAADCLLPMRLRDVGVPEDALPSIAETALGDAAIFTNPRPISYDDALDLLRRLVQQEQPVRGTTGDGLQITLELPGPIGRPDPPEP